MDGRKRVDAAESVGEVFDTCVSEKPEASRER